MIEINGLYKTYNYKKSGAFEALHDISVTIEDGTMNAIIGRSGSGKSTLLHILGCIDSFEKGSYKFNGKEIAEYSEKERALFRSENVGIVLQDFSLIETYSVLENVLTPFYFTNKTYSKKEMKSKALAVLKSVRLDKLENKSVNKLSGGQKQRLSIARALTKKPEIFIFDDSFSALDFKTDSALRKALKEHTSNATVLIVAQRISTIMNAEQIIVLDEGKIVGKGTHQELLKNCQTYYEIASSQLSKEELDNE